jgi:hypothetical protein
MALSNIISAASCAVSCVSVTVPLNISSTPEITTFIEDPDFPVPVVYLVLRIAIIITPN